MLKEEKAEVLKHQQIYSTYATGDFAHTTNLYYTRCGKRVVRTFNLVRSALFREIANRYVQLGIITDYMRLSLTTHG